MEYSNENENTQINVAKAVETVTCPYCGEDIRPTAKKCKHCGEWLEPIGSYTATGVQSPINRAPLSEVNEASRLVPYDSSEKVSLILQSVGQNKLETVRFLHDYLELSFADAKELSDNTPVTIKRGLLMSDAQELKRTFEQLGAKVAIIPEGNQYVKAETIPLSPEIINANNTTNPSQPLQQSQQIVVNVQNTNVLEQSQTVVVPESQESAPAWIIGEMWLLAAGIGWGLGSWVWFFVAGIGLTILLMIPFIGALLCYLVGACWGLLAGVFCAGLWNPTAGWIIGFIVALLSISFHIEAREKNMEEFNNE